MFAALVLAGCGAQAIRKDADKQIRAGKYEQALTAYDKALASNPDNVVLKAGVTSARATIFQQLVAEANRLRAAGNDDAAEKVIQRALSIDPHNKRAQSLGLEIARDKRQREVLREARDLLSKGFHERAQLTVETALKESPGNTELRELQRQLESAARQAQSLVTRLAETRPISLDFKDASLRSILDVVTRSSGIKFVIDKDVRADLQATIWIQNTKLEDALELLMSTNQLAYKVLDSATVLIYPRTPEKIKEYQELMIRAFYLSSADAKQTAIMLKTMLKIRDPFVDDKLNLIVVRESAETIRLAERLIALQDMSEPEVLMEVEVLEIKKSSLTELGIKYPDSFSLTPLLPQAAGGLTLGTIRNLNRGSIGINSPTVQLNLHRDVDDVHILANPKIRARNREKARVLIGDKLPVITTTGSAANSNFISESVQYVDVGLKLEVEPNIYLDDEVALKVGLEVSSLVREIKTSGGSLVYQIGTRTANTVLRLRDGETQLLAGLMSNEERTSANRIPGLGDLPVIGRLFASQRDNGQRTEIVLSITPRIVRNIRRPDLHLAEFWSGTENDVRSKPLAMSGMPAGARAAPVSGAEPGSDPQKNNRGPTPAEPPGPKLAFRLVAPPEVKVGDEVLVHVDLKSDVPLRGIPLELSFSPGTLDVLDAETGEFLLQGGGGTVGTTRTLEQANGRAAVSLLRNVPSGAKGEGRALTFKFKATAPGVAEVRLTSAKGIAIEPFHALPLPEPTFITIK